MVERWVIFRERKRGQVSEREREEPRKLSERNDGEWQQQCLIGLHKASFDLSCGMCIYRWMDGWMAGVVWCACLCHGARPKNIHDGRPVATISSTTFLKASLARRGHLVLHANRSENDEKASKIKRERERDCKKAVKRAQS